MSLFSNIITWALRAVTSNEAKQIGLRAVGDAANQLVQQITKHSPDMAQSCQSEISSAVAKSVAGILSRTK